ncbi:LPS O-antigen chain length determinant protein WzzB [Pseudomonas umsongensis]|jgi:chain length determinant protein (polysaccharide antigen chain regulator)|uniref:LPS O-antigen chain length determinant protein WzzB n=1 Tax=Pseudomonas umsongensis TaxID=198618 RepID=UPI0015C1C0C2|nr:Wzz/FepE/Etk N-terminal domain-containing protein [Pseudomonas umsongensis]NWL19520.1 chain-length determining protein [Pseudomonas umsongensis]
MRNNRAEPRPNDEVDLIEVIQGLWLQKWLILAIVTLFTLVGGAYAFLSKPVYEARAFVIPPTQKDIADLNYGRTIESELAPYSVKSVYEVFLRNLQAESLRRAFFEEYYLPSLNETERAGSHDGLYQRFSKELSIALADKSSPDRFLLTMQNNDPAKAEEWAKAYIEKARILAVREMVENVNREAEVRARNLAQQISALRENGERVREDLITQLREALRIAEAVGLEKPPIINGNLSGEVSANMSGELTYIRGSKALQAEIKNIEERKLDDPFIKNLRALQMKYSFYKDLSVKPDDVAVFRVDGPIESPDKPVKPKKALVLAVAVLLGGVIGVFVALFRILYRRNRELRSLEDRE